MDKNKTKEILTIALVFTFFIGAGVFTYFFGVKSHDYHYIRLDVNPKVEFITNDKNEVLTVYPVNHHAKLLLVDEQFIGLDIKEAVENFFDLCVRTNYIDISGEDNTVRITVVAGFMQALEMQVYETLNNYLIKNEILTVIVENDNDRTEETDAKDENVSSPNKLALIKTIMLQAPDQYEFEELNSKNENKLIVLLKKLHQKNYNPNNHSDEDRELKLQLINNTAQKIEAHKAKLTNQTARAFHEKFDEYKRNNKIKYERDFDAVYNANFPDEKDDDEVLE